MSYSIQLKGRNGLECVVKIIAIFLQWTGCFPFRSVLFLLV